MAKDVNRMKDKYGIVHMIEDTVARGLFYSLSDVAVSGSFNDLKDLPAISVFANDVGYLTSHQSLDHKQDKLVSGENIKTINGHSLLGRGNIDFNMADITINGVSAPTYISTAIAQARDEITTQLANYTPSSNLSDYINDVGYATESYVDSKIDLLLGDGEISQTFDTIKEISDYIGTHGSEYSSLVSDVQGKANASSLATVATSGSYNDLSNKPTIAADFDAAVGTELPTVSQVRNYVTANAGGILVATPYSEETGTITLEIAGDVSNYTYSDETGILTIDFE